MGRPKVVKVKSAKALVEKYMKISRGAKLTKSQFGIGATDDKGNIIKLDTNDFIKLISEVGNWGFADVAKHTIYVWHKKGLSFNKRLELFAHELGHMTGKQCRAMNKEEERAISYQMVAGLAHRFAMKYK